MDNNRVNEELGWDDVIEKDPEEFILLPEGDYNFTVESFDRGRHQGSDKLPPCNKAVLRIKVDSPDGAAFLTHNLFLHKKTEGLLSAFFACIGQKKKGEPLRMDWGRVAGACGRAKIGVHTYRNKDGEERKSNEIKRFYPMESGPAFKAGEF